MERDASIYKDPPYPGHPGPFNAAILQGYQPVPEIDPFKPTVPWVDEVIVFLNQMLEIDRSFVTRLIRHRELCNAVMANTSPIQCFTPEEWGEGINDTGASVLGFLNGMVGMVGGTGENRLFGAISAVTGDKGQILCFTRTDQLFQNTKST